jgi:hypothetical protein
MNALGHNELDGHYCSVDCIDNALEQQRLNNAMLKAALKSDWEELGNDIKGLAKPTDDRNEVSDKALKTLKEVMYKQDDFGIEKYGVPLKDHYDYDWLQMFMEEMADGLKYIQNEMDRKNKVIQTLELAIASNEFELVKSALEILRRSGTGK